MHTTHPSVVSSKEIERVRRLAKRVRAAVACARCKSFKVKCNDYRPCKQCSDNSSVCASGKMKIRGSTNQSLNHESAVHEGGGFQRSEEQSEVEMKKMVNVHTITTEHSGQNQSASLQPIPAPKHSATDSTRLGSVKVLRGALQMQDTHFQSASHRLAVQTTHFESSATILHTNPLQSSHCYNQITPAAVSRPFSLPLYAPSQPPMSAQIAALLHSSSAAHSPPAMQLDVHQFLAALSYAASPQRSPVITALSFPRV